MLVNKNITSPTVSELAMATVQTMNLSGEKFYPERDVKNEKFSSLSTSSASSMDSHSYKSGSESELNSSMERETDVSMEMVPTRGTGRPGRRNNLSRRKGRVGSDLANEYEAYLHSCQDSDISEEKDEVENQYNKGDKSCFQSLAPGKQIDVLQIHRSPGERLGMGLNIQHTKGPNSVIQGVSVKNVIPGGAAERATGGQHGICVNDVILGVDGSILQVMTYAETVELLSELPLNIEVVVARETADLSLREQTSTPEMNNGNENLQQPNQGPCTEEECWDFIEQREPDAVLMKAARLVNTSDAEKRNGITLEYRTQELWNTIETCQNGSIEANNTNDTTVEDEYQQLNNHRDEDSSKQEETLIKHSDGPQESWGDKPNQICLANENHSMYPDDTSEEEDDDEEDLGDLLMLDTELTDEDEDEPTVMRHRYSMPLPKPKKELLEDVKQESDEKKIDNDENNSVDLEEPEAMDTSDPPITDIDDLILSGEEEEMILKEEAIEDSEMISPVQDSIQMAIFPDKPTFSNVDEPDTSGKVVGHPRVAEIAENEVILRNDTPVFTPPPPMMDSLSYDDGRPEEMYESDAEDVIPPPLPSSSPPKEFTMESSQDAASVPHPVNSYEEDDVELSPRESDQMQSNLTRAMFLPKKASVGTPSVKTTSQGLPLLAKPKTLSSLPAVKGSTAMQSLIDRSRESDGQVAALKLNQRSPSPFRPLTLPLRSSSPLTIIPDRAEKTFTPASLQEDETTKCKQEESKPIEDTPNNSSDLSSAIEDIFASVMDNTDDFQLENSIEIIMEEPEDISGNGSQQAQKSVTPERERSILMRPPTGFGDDSSSCSSPEKEHQPIILGLPRQRTASDSSSSLNLSDTSDQGSDEDFQAVTPLPSDTPLTPFKNHPLMEPERLSNLNTTNSNSNDTSQLRLFQRAHSLDDSTIKGKKVIQVNFEFNFDQDSSDDEILPSHVRKNRHKTGNSGQKTSEIIFQVNSTPEESPKVNPDVSSNQPEKCPTDEAVEVKTESPVSPRLHKLDKSDSSSSDTVTPLSPRLPPDGHESPEQISKCPSAGSSPVPSPTLRGSSDQLFEKVPDFAVNSTVTEVISIVEASNPVDRVKETVKRPSHIKLDSDNMTTTKRVSTMISPPLKPCISPKILTSEEDKPTTPSSVKERASIFGPVLKRRTPQALPKSPVLSSQEDQLSIEVKPETQIKEQTKSPSLLAASHDLQSPQPENVSDDKSVKTKHNDRVNDDKDVTEGDVSPPLSGSPPPLPGSPPPLPTSPLPTNHKTDEKTVFNETPSPVMVNKSLSKTTPHQSGVSFQPKTSTPKRDVSPSASLDIVDAFIIPTCTLEVQTKPSLDESLPNPEPAVVKKSPIVTLDKSQPGINHSKEDSPPKPDRPIPVSNFPRAITLKSSESSQNLVVPPLRASSFPKKPSILDSVSPKPVGTSKLKGLSVPKKLSASTTVTSPTQGSLIPKLGSSPISPKSMPVLLSTKKSQAGVTGTARTKLTFKKFPWDKGVLGTEPKESDSNPETNHLKPGIKPDYKPADVSKQLAPKPLARLTPPADDNKPNSKTQQQSKISEEMPAKKQTLKLAMLSATTALRSPVLAKTLKPNDQSNTSNSKSISEPAETQSSQMLNQAPPTKSPVSSHKEDEVSARPTSLPPPLPESSPPRTSTPPKTSTPCKTSSVSSAQISEEEDDLPPALPLIPPPPTLGDSLDASIEGKDDPDEGVLEIKVRAKLL